MYLKSVEIKGFKSFPDRIVLDFDSGLTAVVGPNGSGKSNIGDAVSWVLGEQSAKNLRGTKMEDVIFSGTESRKPVGFAEVTLRIENAQGALPVDSDEVFVTRKLYRSGESEYLINGSPVRLRDVNEIFMDTGLGKGGYSIIGQGRIAEIINAKPADRRFVFEEASGISKFKFKKEEAVAKLQQAQVHYLRLNDSRIELGERVAPLKLQAEKAEKYLVLRDRKKELEISLWLAKIAKLHESIEEAEQSRLVCSSEYDNLFADIERCEEQKNAARSLADKLLVDADWKQREISGLRDGNARSETNIAVLKHDIDLLNEKKEELRAEKENKLASIETQKQAVIELERKTEALVSEERDCAEEQQDTVDSLNIVGVLSDELDEKFSKANAELNALYIKRSELSSSIISIEAGLMQIDAELAENARREKDISDRAMICGEELEGSKKALLRASQEQLEHKNKADGFKRLYSSKKDKHAERSAEAEKAGLDLNFRQQRIKILTDLENSLEGFSGSVRAVLKASKNGALSGVRGSLAQLISVEAQYSLAIETALGAAIQNIVVENENTAKRCIRHLKDTGGGRATFLPLTAIKGRSLNEPGTEDEDGYVGIAEKLVSRESELDEICLNLLGKIVVAEDLDSASSIAKKYGYRFKIVTLDGQVINAGGSFTGGSTKNSGGILTRRNEIEKLQGEAAVIEEKRKKLLAEVERLKIETDKLGFDVEGEQELERKCTLDIAEINGEIGRLESELSLLDAQKFESERASLRLDKRKTDSSKALSDARGGLDECSLLIENAEKSRDDEQSRASELKERREKIIERLNEIKIRRAELARDIEANNNALSEQQLHGDELSRLRDEADSAIEQCKNDIKRIIDEIKAAEASLKEVADTIASYESEIGELREKRQSAEGDARRCEIKIKQLLAEKEDIGEQKARLEEKLGSLGDERNTIVDRMLEEYSVTYTEACKIASPPQNQVEARRELNDVNAKMKALGHVYLDAIEEYKEISARYEFLSSQLSDVEQSKKQLESIIADLTDNMRARFEESFGIINGNFAEIFKELFGGGKAELVLTDPGDVLESGIDIIVAPPGKIFKNLLQLSGGEQAFIAIAIYFAIMKLRPSPFCILDEIDAALDEVNVVKFAQYLRNFTDMTQFIMVTHKRGAMDAADVLYGVTMQSDGVSKLLKMSQSELEKSSVFTDAD